MGNSDVRAVLKPNAYKDQRELMLKEPLFDYELSPMISYGKDKGSHIQYEHAIDKNDL